MNEKSLKLELLEKIIIIIPGILMELSKKIGSAGIPTEIIRKSIRQPFMSKECQFC